MSARQWKPGDVAVLAMGPGGSVPIRALRTTVGYWFDTDGVTVEDSEPWGVRPLVVIDPEDAEQIARFVAECEPDWGFCGYPEVNEPQADVIAEFQRVLRVLADPTPPRPEEPTGLGAVVEDEDGRRWVRSFRDDDSPWVSDATLNRSFDEIAVVRVLSPGVES